MSLFTHNLRKCGQLIEISKRDDKIINGSTSEVFTDPVEVKAIIKTVEGVTVFDSQNVERTVTHKVLIEYIPDFESTERWVLFKGRRIKIVSVENCCEKDEELILYCSERGDNNKVANHA